MEWKVERLDFRGCAQDGRIWRVARDCLNAPPFQRTGIRIVFVGEDDSVTSVTCPEAESVAELDASLATVLDPALKGEQ